MPNLKNLRDMIKRNSPSHLKSERTVKNESECSFTLTDDEEQSIGGRRSSINKRVKGKSAVILIEEAKEETVDEEDVFLKELEQENKLLEEELKNLQSKPAGFLPRQQESNRSGSGAPVQRKIRFQDEQQSPAKEATPKPVASPYVSNRSSNAP